MFDTSLENNIKNIRPFLGILLVGSVALGFVIIIKGAADQLTESIQTTTPVEVEGSLSVKTRGKLHYADTVEYRSNISGISPRNTTTYITTVCFQKEEIVYQRSALQGVSIYLHDQVGQGLEWDGGAASCSATLMYRVVSTDVVNVYIVDAISFDVAGR